MTDYKFYCFDGKPEAMLLISDRNMESGTCCDYYDKDFNHLPVEWAYQQSEHPLTSKPYKFDEMKKLASDLSKGIPQVRVDLYCINGKIYLGEMTFFHGSGLRPFENIFWDKWFGDFIQLPKS